MRCLVSIGDKVDLTLAEEECCELCGDIIGTMIEHCPSCEASYTPTNYHHEFGYKDGERIRCQNCRTEFALDLSDGRYLVTKTPAKKPPL